MKYTIVILFFFINVNCSHWGGITSSSQWVSYRDPGEDSLTINNAGKSTAGKEIGDSVICAVEEMPQFPGGDRALYLCIAKELHYPLLAKHEGVEGKVKVEFVVTKNGKVTDIQVINGIGYGCDAEAIRVFKLLPDWIPGKKNGIPVNVRVTFPLVFKLH